MEDGAMLEQDAAAPRLRIAGYLLSAGGYVVYGLELGGDIEQR
jgi:hypothetical protein